MKKQILLRNSIVCLMTILTFFVILNLDLLWYFYATDSQILIYIPASARAQSNVHGGMGFHALLQVRTDLMSAVLALLSVSIFLNQRSLRSFLSFSYVLYILYCPHPTDRIAQDVTKQIPASTATRRFGFQALYLTRNISLRIHCIVYAS